jgi:DNA polymerase elongation subunit (family B)
MTNKKAPKVLCWDLETSSLNANGGFIICASIVDASKPKGVKTFRIDHYKGWKRDPWNDRDLVTDLVDYLADGDVQVTYYGKRFDAPFLSTRVLYWRSRGRNIPLPSNIPHIDLYDTARRKLKLHSNRLQVVSNLLGHGDKTPLELPVWLKAAGGHRPSIQYVVKHCEKDAIILANNYLDLRPLIPAHPHLGMLEGHDRFSCQACGSENVQKRGPYVTESTRRQRLSCNDCGRWGSQPEKQEKRTTIGRRNRAPF